MTRATVFFVSCVRGWTRWYTWRLPPAVRDARREEIESDLWESLHDPEMTAGWLVVQMMMRLTLGIPDDLAWRLLSHPTATRSAMLRTAMTAAAMCTLLLVAALSRLSANVPHLPEPPLSSRHVHTIRNPPPPPPAPGATTWQAPVFQYGRTSYAVVTEGPSLIPIKQVSPIYPPVAVAAGLEGEVLVQARIAEDGCVTDAEVAPAGILGHSALHAVQQWEFAAAGRGTRRPALLTVRVTFGRSQ
jgi:TonB family protein